MFFTLFIALSILVVTVCNDKPKLVEKCLKSYIENLSTLQIDPLYLQAVRSHLNSVSKSSSFPRKTLILDVGLGSIKKSQVFYHMMQLNVSGMDYSGRSSFNCKYDSVSVTHASKKSSDPHPIGSRHQAYVDSKNLVQSTGLVSWLVLLDRFPNTLVLMNDLTDEEWFANQHLPECTASSSTSLLPDHCYLPILPLGGSYNRNRIPSRSLNSMLLSSLSKEKISSALAAYRSLITCAVPPSQLFQFNLNSIPSADYWSRLTSLLGITLTPQKAAALASAGLFVPLSPQGAYQGVSPSVCDKNDNVITTTTAAAAAALTSYNASDRLESCAAQYAEDLATIFGAQYRNLVLSQMLRKAEGLASDVRSDTRRLVLGVGPGSTGTSSIFAATNQLNVTGRHNALYSHNCAGGDKPAKQLQPLIDSSLHILSDSHSSVFGSPVYWTDTPVPELWFSLIRAYPNTRIVMTDVRDDVEWLRKRRKHYCHHKQKESSDQWDSSCTVPLAFSVPSSQHSELSASFLREAHLSSMEENSASQSFAAYRRLVRCAVPKQQLLWLFIKEQDSSPFFWRNLIAFFNVSVSSAVKEALIHEGIPRLGKSGCFKGDQPCRYEGEAKSTALVPSVCCSVSNK